MPKASPRAGAKSSLGTDKRVGGFRQGCRLIAAVMQKLQARFGTKMPIELALRTNAAPRSGERWKAGKSMSGENLAELIRSDVGDDVIDAIVGTDPRDWPEWYALYHRQVRLSKLRRDQLQLQKELNALEAGAM